MDEFDFGDYDPGSFDFGDIDFGDIDLGDIDFGDIDLSSLDEVDLSGLQDLDPSTVDFGPEFDQGTGGDFGSEPVNFDLSSDDMRPDMQMEQPSDVGGVSEAGFGTDEELKKLMSSGIGGFDMEVPQSSSAGVSGQPSDAGYSDTTEEVQPWQNLEGSGTTQLSDAYKYENGKWSIRGYYDEETGQFVPDPNGPLVADESNEFDPLKKSGMNASSMDKYGYDRKTGTWTTPGGQTYKPNQTPSYSVKTGDRIMKDAGVMDKTIIDRLKEVFTGKTGTGGQGQGTDWMKLLLALAAMSASRGGGSSSAVIPTLSGGRSQTPYGELMKQPGYRPGQGGIQYFGPMVYRATGGGIASLDAAGGRLLQGPGDGVSDDIVAQIGDDQPARLADGEYVLDARTVSEIGNGSTDAGAKKIAQMVERIHSERKTAQRGKPSNADKHLLA